MCYLSSNKESGVQDTSGSLDDLQPGVSHLRVFGCIAYAKVPEAYRTKLEDKGVKCILVGYGDRTMGYRLYNPITERIIHSRDVTFEENESWKWL